MSEKPDDELRDGRSTRWDPHRKQRRLTIINAAVAAIEEYGPDALTAQIAEKASVPRTHVYRHFDGKQALDLAVSTHIGTMIADQIRAGLAVGATPRELIHGAIEGHLGWIEAHPNLYRFLGQHAYAVRTTPGSEAAADAKATLASELTTLFKSYLRALEVDTEPTERTIIGVVGLVDATAVWWLERHDPPRAALTAELTDRVWLLIDYTARALGVTLAPDAALPRV